METKPKEPHEKINTQIWQRTIKMLLKIYALSLLNEMNKWMTQTEN
jgi:hypothetical protein